MALGKIENMTRRKTKATKTTAKQMMEAAYGKEPCFADRQMTLTDYRFALTWYSNTIDKETNKQYLLDYLKHQGRTDDYNKAKKISADWFTSTFGGISRLLIRDAPIPPTGPKWIDANLAALIEKYELEKKDEEVKVEKPKVSVQERMAAKARHVSSEIEYLFDEKVWDTGKETASIEDIHKALKKAEVSGPVATMTIPFLQERLDELREIPNHKDLQEAYKQYKKTELKKFIEFFENAIAACQQIADNTKRVRKPRRKKTISVDKKLAKFKYMKEYMDWHLVSIDPSKAIGAMEVWLYMPKYRELKVIRALDRSGLDIKGQTFLNVSDKSDAKRIRQREAQSIVTQITKGGKRKANQLLKNAKGSSPTVTYRCSENHLIVGAYK